MPILIGRWWPTLAVAAAIVAGGAPEAGPLQNGRSGDGPGAVEWSKVQINDVVTRDAAIRALTAASKWLSDPKCERLFAEFDDVKGLALSSRLRELQATPEAYLRLIFFFDGAQHATCRRDGILAFTTVGSQRSTCVGGISSAHGSGIRERCKRRSFTKCCTRSASARIRRHRATSPVACRNSVAAVPSASRRRPMLAVAPAGKPLNVCVLRLTREIQDRQLRH